MVAYDNPLPLCPIIVPASPCTSVSATHIARPHIVAGEMCLLCAEQAAHTRQCKDISLAYLYATTPHMFSPEDNTEQAFSNVRDAVRTPLYGCDCYAYGLLASGHVDLVVEADLKPYDFMALVPIVEEAGGVMTDWLVGPHRHPCNTSLTAFTLPLTAFIDIDTSDLMFFSHTWLLM